MPYRRRFRQSRSSRGPVARRDKMWGHFFLPREPGEQRYVAQPGYQVAEDRMVIVPVWNNEGTGPLDGTLAFHSIYGKEPSIVRTILNWDVTVDWTAPSLGTQKNFFFGLTTGMANYSDGSDGVVTMSFDSGMLEVSRSQGFLYSRFGWLGEPNAIVADWPAGGTNQRYPAFSRSVLAQDLRVSRILKENEVWLLWLGFAEYDGGKSIFFNADWKSLFLTP